MIKAISKWQDTQTYPLRFIYTLMLVKFTCVQDKQQEQDVLMAVTQVNIKANRVKKIHYLQSQISVLRKFKNTQRGKEVNENFCKDPENASQPISSTLRGFVLAICFEFPLPDAKATLIIFSPKKKMFFSFVPNKRDI